MPQTRELTEDELNHLEAQGYDSSEYRGKKVTVASDDELAQMSQQPAAQTEENKPSIPGALAASMRQHGLSAAAGGLVGSAIMAGLAPETGGLSLLPLLGTIAAGTAGGMATSALVQKGQEAVEGDETANRLNKEAQAGEEAHPWATGIEDIALGSLAGGFRPSLSGGVRNAVKNAALQTGVGAATDLVTGQPITVRGMLLNATGGAVFNKPFGPIGGLHPSEPVAEPLKGEVPPTPDTTDTTTPQPKQSPWTMQNEDGNHLLNDKSVGNAYKEFKQAPQRKDFGEDYTAYQVARQKYNDMGIDEQRQELHNDWLSKQATSTPAPTISIPQPEIPKAPNATIGDETAQGGEMENYSNKMEGDTTSSGYSPEEIHELQSRKQNVTDAVKNWQQEQLLNGPASQHPDVIAAQQKAQESAKRLADFNAALVEKYKQEAAEHNPPASDAQPADLTKGVSIGNNVGRPEVVTRTGPERMALKRELQTKALADRQAGGNQSLAQDRAEKIYTAPTQDNWSNPEDRKLHTDLQAKMKEVMMKNPNDPELFKLFKQFEDVRNRNGGMPPEKIGAASNSTNPLGQKASNSARYLIGNDKGTGIGLAQALAKDNPEYSGILKHIISTGALDNARASHTDQSWSGYDPANRRINLRAQHLNDPKVVLEELIHAATSDTLINEVGYGDSDKAIANYQGNNKGVKTLIEAYKAARESGDKTLLKHAYQLKDLHEFLAGAFHDKEFAEKLNKIKTQGETKSVFHKILDAVKQMLGFNPEQGSALEKVISAAHDIFKEQGRDNSIVHFDENGTRITDLDARIHTKPSDEEPSTKRGWISTIDNIRTHVSKSIADAFQKTAIKNDQNVGSTWNKLKSTMDRVGFTKADGEQLQKVAKWENINNAKAPSTMFRNNAQREVYKMERQVFDEAGKRNIADKVPVFDSNGPRLLKQNPFSHPTPVNPDVAKVIRENTDKGQIASLKKDYLNSATKDYKISPPVAEKMYQGLVDHMQGKSASSSTSTPMFAGSRLPEGIPLPDSWQKGNYSQRLETYYRRNAMDNAFYNNVESNPDVWSKLGNTKDAWGNKITPSKEDSYQNNSYVKSQLNEFSAAHAGKTNNPIEKGWSSLAAQMFIANPGIELHKIGSNLIGLTSYMSNPKQVIGALTQSLHALSSGLEHATENGLLKLTSRSVGDLVDRQSTMLDRMRGLAKLFNTVGTLGGFTEKLSTGLLQAGIEGILPDKIQRANKGDTSEQQLLKRIDPSYQVGKSYNNKEVSQLASSLAGFIHGTHDGRTMPKWMQSDNEISGLAQLAHWSVAQTARFMNDIVEPAKSGNYKPLVISLVGSALGGAIIKEMREKLQGKDGPIPSLNEIANSGATPGRKAAMTAYNLTSAAQYAGFAGLFSTGVKDAMDLVYKNHPQGTTFPLDEIATSLAQNVSQFASAAVNDKNFNWGRASVELTKNILTQNVQLARMGLNQAINNDLVTGPQAEKKKLGDKMNELRKFEMTQGLPYQEQEPSTANPYMDIESKAFRNEPDPYKAASRLPGILQSIISNNSSNPDVIQSKLKGLKSMQYPSMPSPERMPVEFARYIDFLKRTRGETYANEMIKDYMTHEVINQAKSSLIPSI